jgi:hypothetical protein
METMTMKKTAKSKAHILLTLAILIVAAVLVSPVYAEPLTQDPVDPPGDEGETTGAAEVVYQGCPASYWKTVRGDRLLRKRVGMVFASTGKAMKTDWLKQALKYQSQYGGRTLVRRILVREGVAAWLNAMNGNVNYPLTPQEVQNSVNAALKSRDRARIGALGEELRGYNNLECPLSQ